MKYNLLQNFSSFFPLFPDYIIKDIIKSLKEFKIIGIKVSNDKKKIGKINISINTVGDFNVKRTFIISNISDTEIEEKIVEQKYNSSSVTSIIWNKNDSKKVTKTSTSFKDETQYIYEEGLIYEEYKYDKEYILVSSKKSKALYENMGKTSNFNLQGEPEYFYTAIYNMDDDCWHITTTDYECIIKNGDNIEKLIEYRSIINEILSLYSELKKEKREEILIVSDDHLGNIKRRKRTFTRT